ncbi:MAG: MerR family transcriptional regulator [Phenylobacterium sp.]|uniref:MerR family transcriptional regulator n=1 Tax=Phenylobacterium sp. TaxID=1871053 RepID=UPI0027329E23|nr:MerR family transcriptional regulator [Phenylobacterium sp.]MDP3174857.1 MerR family transcriptional regulator [Phenylobacterium sp.]
MAKGPDAFRTISEAAEELNVPQHVLRFWETKFSFIRPMKRAGGRRFYRPQDVAILRGVRCLLYEDGYTIKGVQRLHREEGLKRLAAAGQGDAAPSASVEAIPDLETAPAKALDAGSRARLSEALGALEAAQARLDALLRR